MKMLTQRATVYLTERGEIVLTYDPIDNEESGEEEQHNCDAQGCGFEHVLLRVPLAAVRLDPSALAMASRVEDDTWAGRAVLTPED